MENKITKEKILIITTILVVSIVFIGIGYAFFTANNPEGSTAQIISKSGRMLINYNDGTDSIIPLIDIQPSNNILVDKTFNLTGINTTVSDGLPMPYVISIEYQNTFKNDELEYYIKRIDENESINCTIKNVGLVNEYILSSLNLPSSLNGYRGGTIYEDSGKMTTQELAYGYFKPSTEEQVLTLNLKLMFRDSRGNQDYNKGAKFNGKIVVTAPETETFTMATWKEIADNVKSGNASKYSVGTEKEVEIDGTSYTVRVANNSTPDECNGTNFSQTACGFVVEFVDLLELRQMNSTDTNVGGWPASEMRTYVNGDFFNKLPSDLQSVIIDTKVVSGHGSSDKNANRTDGNWESTDKIYLLSAHEVYEDGTSDEVSTRDTAYSQTRQLDYYKQRGVIVNNHTKNAIKDYNGMPFSWWLRAANSNNSIDFISVNADRLDIPDASRSYGFAPAFRIGENVNNV